MGERPDIGKMIEEELAKGEAPKAGEKPLEVTAEGEIREAETDEVDEAFEGIMAEGGDKAVDSMKLADMGGDAARKIQMAFEKGDHKAVQAAAEAFLAQADAAGADAGEAKAVLREQLKAYHDTYFEAGLKEKAAEIDSFSRSLESSSEVSTEAGREFVDKLEAGGFTSIEQAINALDDIKNRAAKGEPGETADQRKDREGKLNAEFNVLYAKINERFLGTRDSGEHRIDIGDDDIDDVLGALG